MNSTEEKVLQVEQQLGQEIAHIEAWYADHRFYAGIIIGMIVGALVFHYLAKL